MRILLAFTFALSSVCSAQIVPSSRSQRGDTLDLSIEKTTLRRIRSPWGGGLAVGISKYNYDDRTASWLGSHGGPTFQGILSYKEWTFFAGVKPWTVSPERNLVFNGNTLDNFARLNPIKVEIDLGYRVTLSEDFSAFPYLGWTRSTFDVINEDVLKIKYDIPSTSGITFGSYLSYSFIGTFSEEYSIRLCANYSIVDFSNVHPLLGRNYWAIEIGVSVLGWFVRDEEINLNTR